MISLDEKYHSYLEKGKSLKIDGVNEKLTGYGYSCDGSEIVGFFTRFSNVLPWAVPTS